MSIREDPSGSIGGFEQGRGTGYPSLSLCLIEESLFGAAIHNLLRLIRSLQSGRHQFFHFSPAWGTYESYSLMWQLGQSDWSYWTSSLWCTRTLRASVSIREDPSGSIGGFEQGRGTGYPSLSLCLIEESLFGAAIHNLLRLIRSLQSGRHQFFHFSPAWGTYESYSLMWQLGRAIEVIGLAIRRLRLQFQYGFAVCISNRKRILNEKIVNYKVIFKFYNFRIKKRTCSFI